ncbi:MAG: hypothetical protein K2Q20_00480, partial [Phycisphaerales bacterium]|nr:hypothetical protein [Phycisphaerales bacterium]
MACGGLVGRLSHGVSGLLRRPGRGDGMTPVSRSSALDFSFRGDDRQRVLDATDIVRLIGEQMALKQKGREYVCLCPFHDDHSPS